jgi:hypothetical protein
MVGGMRFKREALSILKTIQRAGYHEKVVIIIPSKRDNFSGVQVGAPEEIPAFMAQVEYTDKELADDTLANGLMKILVSPVLEDLSGYIPSFISLIRNKGTMIRFSDGRLLSIRVSRFTAPDGVTPILSRIYLGG